MKSWSVCTRPSCTQVRTHSWQSVLDMKLYPLKTSLKLTLAECNLVICSPIAKFSWHMVGKKYYDANKGPAQHTTQEKCLSVLTAPHPSPLLSSAPICTVAHTHLNGLLQLQAQVTEVLVLTCQLPLDFLKNNHMQFTNGTYCTVQYYSSRHKPETNRNITLAPNSIQ